LQPLSLTTDWNEAVEFLYVHVRHVIICYANLYYLLSDTLEDRKEI